MTPIRICSFDDTGDLSSLSAAQKLVTRNQVAILRWY